MSTDPYLSPQSDEVTSTTTEGSGAFWLALIVGGGALALLGFVFLLVVSGMSQRGMPAAKRTQCKNNLKQIGLALHNYQDVYGSLPPAFTVSAQGQKLHSWRTLILPFMEQQVLYESINLSKPWNHPANEDAMKQRPEIFVCPSSDIPDTHTTYMGLIGEDCFFSGDQPRTFREFSGGTSNAIAVMEVSVNKSVHWMEPTDNAGELSNLKADEMAHAGGFQAVLADGTARFVSANIPSEIWNSVVSISQSAKGEW